MQTVIRALLVLASFGPVHQSVAEDLSAVFQVKQSLNKIRTLDSTYNAVIALSPTAENEAAELDKSGIGILAGMPILVKDNIDVLGLPNTAGSLALKDDMPVQDAPSIAGIRAAGGVILGKTNLSEWANFRSEKSSSGWSAIGGQTRNAHDVLRSPCGSSSGSGVAVALGYVKVAIGTETHGSIICPATSNGVVGFKPTHGIVSGAGIVPISASQDTAGPIADTVENAALVLSAMLDPTNGDYAEMVNGLRALDSGAGLKGLRIGIQASTLEYDPRRDALFENAVKRLTAAGVEIIEGIKLQPYDELWQENYQLLQYEFRRDLNAYLASRKPPVNSLTLKKLIEFNNQNAERELVHFDQGIFEKSQNLDLSEQDYLAIRERGHNATREDGLEKVFADHKLDALIGISGGPAWLIDHINGDSFFGPGMSGYPAIGGYPHITVPGGKIKGLPMGISFIGKRYEDHKLAQIAHRFMQLAD